MFISILENNLKKMKMKNIKINYFIKILLFSFLTILFPSCERELSNDATLSANNKNPEIFIDGFSSGLGYGAFGGSKYTAFTVDTETKYQGTASMRFDVPSVGDPNGSYAGGVFIDGGGRDLESYDALTFWIKGSQAATLNDIGIGTDFGLNKYKVTMSNVSIGTNWQKVIIPLPDASKLEQEKGMFWYSEGPENGLGYTFWIDNVRYEKLGTIAHPKPAILNGVDKVEQTFIGSETTLSGLTDTFNMASGANQTVTVAPGYYTFVSSAPEIASVNDLGVVTIKAAGTSIIKATLNGVQAAGSLTVNSLGVFTLAPIPTVNAANVISIFSNAYTNVPVEYYNGYYAPYQTTLGQADLNVNGDNIIKYSLFNFVGIQFAQPTINASQMTYFHIDLKVQNTTGARNSIKFKLVDFGADSIYGGGNDVDLLYTYNNAALATGNWVSLEVPLTVFSGSSNKLHMAQIILESTSGITDLLVDNIYFHK